MIRLKRKYSLIIRGIVMQVSFQAAKHRVYDF